MNIHSLICDLFLENYRQMSAVNSKRFPILFQVNLEGNKVRRQLAIGDVPVDVDSRTVYVVRRVLCSDFNLIFAEKE